MTAKRKTTDALRAVEAAERAIDKPANQIRDSDLQLALAQLRTAKEYLQRAIPQIKD